jgi:NTP pyrophosphatase (non-canonical NTP hydrolase)
MRSPECGLQEAIARVVEERIRQDKLFPEQAPHWPYPEYHQLLAVLVEEVGEVAKAQLEGGGVLEELTHVAAVAVKMMEIELLKNCSMGN